MKLFIKNISSKFLRSLQFDWFTILMKSKFIWIKTVIKISISSGF